MKRPEQLGQIEIFVQVRALEHLFKDQFKAFAIRNETPVKGKQGKVLGGIAQAMGVLSGVSDSVFLFPEKTHQVIDHNNCTRTESGAIYGSKTVKIPPKTVWVEFKAWDGKGDKNKLLEKTQEDFRGQVTRMGFEYRLIAFVNISDGINQIYELLRENGVPV